METNGREGQGAGDLEAPRAVCPVLHSAERTGEHTRPIAPQMRKLSQRARSPAPSHIILSYRVRFTAI